jgi:lysozyme family protein
MGTVKYSERLAQEYIEMYRTCTFKKGRISKIDDIVDKIASNKKRYEEVAEKINIPWYFIAVIHNMESGLRFDRHLHNGDPLSDRTKHVPKGRPLHGTPPFTWEESAIDALKLRRVGRIKKWSLPRLLYEIEGYNGWGYRLYHPHVYSPYLWSWSVHYRRGKYIADGTWSDTAVSRQCGAAVLLRRMEERNIVSISGEVDAVSEAENSTAEDIYSGVRPVFMYSAKKVPDADKLQCFLNLLSGADLKIDSRPGKKTSEAVKRCFGFYLKGDPRE